VGRPALIDDAGDGSAAARGWREREGLQLEEPGRGHGCLY